MIFNSAGIGTVPTTPAEEVAFRDLYRAFSEPVSIVVKRCLDHVRVVVTAKIAAGEDDEDAVPSYEACGTEFPQAVEAIVAMIPTGLRTETRR